MKTRFLLVICVCLQTAVFGQSHISNQEIPTKASYLGNDLIDELAKNIHPPDNVFTKEMEGDVILRVTIDQQGKLINPVCNYAATIDLGKNAIDAIKALKYDWNPAQSGDNTIPKSYLIVFRYRIKEKSAPKNPYSVINKKIKKEKFDQALQLINTEILDNDFDYFNFLKRAEILSYLGQKDKAKEDKIHAEKLESAVLAIVDFALIEEKTGASIGVLVMSRVPRESFRPIPKNY